MKPKKNKNVVKKIIKFGISEINEMNWSSVSSLVNTNDNKTYLIVHLRN